MTARVLVWISYGLVSVFNVDYPGAYKELKEVIHNELDCWDICLEELCEATSVNQIVSLVQENCVGHHESFDVFQIVNREDIT